MKPTAKFLNSPKLIPVPGTKFVITGEPLVYQYAGGDLSAQIHAFQQSWIAGYNYEDPAFDPKAYLENLVEYYFPIQTVIVAPAGRVTDGPSSPRFARVFGIKAEAFYLSGIMHDFIRGWFTTGNASTDGFLRDMAASEGVNAIRSYLIYAGVRFGTMTGYKCKVPNGFDVRTAYAKARGLLANQVVFNENSFEMFYQV